MGNHQLDGLPVPIECGPVQRGEPEHLHPDVVRHPIDAGNDDAA